MTTTFSQQLQPVDLSKYAGKWYVLASIPTGFDKKWQYETESYALNADGSIAISTTYQKAGDPKLRSFRSKGFPIKSSNNAQWKVQFLWPFKADYLVEELDDSYTTVVVGHPKKKFLYIMNRTGKINTLQYQQILERMQKKGYDLSRLQKVEQGFSE